MSTRPPSRLDATPWLTAFSTSGWSTSAGTTALRAELDLARARLQLLAGELDRHHRDAHRDRDPEHAPARKSSGEVGPDHRDRAQRKLGAQRDAAGDHQRVERPAHRRGASLGI